MGLLINLNPFSELSGYFLNCRKVRYHPDLRINLQFIFEHCLIHITQSRCLLSSFSWIFLHLPSTWPIPVFKSFKSNCCLPSYEENDRPSMCHILSEKCLKKINSVKIYRFVISTMINIGVIRDDNLAVYDVELFIRQYVQQIYEKQTLRQNEQQWEVGKKSASKSSL